MLKKVFLAAEAIFFFVLMLLALSVAFIIFPSLKSEAAAAWVQAVGSVAAIIAAFIIPMRQLRKQLEIANDDKIEARIDTLRTLHELVILGCVRIEMVYDAFSGDRNAIEHYFTKQYSLEDIQDVIEAIGQIPMYEVPGRSVFVSLIGLKRILHKVINIAAEYRPTTYWDESFRTVAASRIKPHLDYAIESRDHIMSEIFLLANFLSSNERRRTVFRDILLEQKNVDCH